jgi:hypothetical protein
MFNDMVSDMITMVYYDYRSSSIEYKSLGNEKKKT